MQETRTRELKKKETELITVCNCYFMMAHMSSLVENTNPVSAVSIQKPISIHSRCRAYYIQIGEALFVRLRISLCELNVKRAFPGKLDAYDFKIRAYLQVGTSRISSACYDFKSWDLEKARLYLRTFPLFRISKSPISH
jgi:hypothetical protein